ncbi:MAG: T9SS type A sorting domain-containing protein [Bacteroidetes bacterium]|nr:T9SS type A sorting domain-containing protein [Bacteroidota bacterium]
MADKFDTGVDPGMWNLIDGGAAGMGCVPYDGQGLYFNGTMVTRQAQTRPLDVSGGGIVYFVLGIGTLGGCDNMDNAAENVSLQYSVNGGLSWTTIGATYGNGALFWNRFAVAIPPAAQTAQTMFRWMQQNHETTTDNWMLDNVYIQVNAPAQAYTYSWTPAALLDDPNSPTPRASGIVAPTTFTLTVTHPVTGCTGTGATTVHMGNRLVPAAANAQTPIVCAGGASRLAAYLDLNDDFDAALNGRLWERIEGATVTTTCASTTGNVLYFNGGTGDRRATTMPMNTTEGATLRFLMRMGGDGGGSPCNDLEASSDEVYLEYSVNGYSWVTLGGPYLANSTAWVPYSIVLPAGAQTQRTQIRWRQNNNANTADNFAIDNVSVRTPVPASGYTYSWSPAAGLDNPVLPQPTATVAATTTYTVVMTDTATRCVDSATVTVRVDNKAIGVYAVADFPSLCTGGTTYLKVIPNDLSDDFDPFLSPSLWGNVTNAVLTSTECGSISGNALTFTLNAGLRAAQTVPLDVPQGGTIAFSLRIGGSAACDNHENAGQNDHANLEYSVDNGATWVTIDQYIPNNPAWVNYSYPIPEAAQTSHTIFRWVQYNAGGGNADEWAIDNVAITAPAQQYTYSWLPAASLDDPTSPTPVATPAANTTYTVTVTNTATQCSGTDMVAVTLDNNPLPVRAIIDNAVVCSGASVQVHALLRQADDFTSGTPDVSVWQSVVGGVVATDCASITGNILKFTGGTSDRRATTWPMDLSTGGTVAFSYRGGGGSGCDNLEAASDEVYLEFSTNLGATWTVFGGPYLNMDWTNLSLSLPELAWSTTTQIRWRQNNNANTADNFAIDNVVITSHALPDSNYAYSWSPNLEIDDPTLAEPTVTPTASRTYTVTMTNRQSGCSNTATVDVAVSNRDITVLATATTPKVCAGSSTQLLATAHVFSESFDAGLTPGLWQTIEGGRVTRERCVAQSGNALMFDEETLLIRQATTQPFDMANGGTLNFRMRVGGDGGSTTGCNDMEAGEGVSVVYSTDGGITWNPLGGPYGTNSTAWNLYSLVLPPAARTSYTQFRWTHTHNAGWGDNYAIDDISIVPNTTQYTYSWSPAVSLNDAAIANPVATPAVTTTYTVTVTNTSTNCSGTRTVQVMAGADTFALSTTAAFPTSCADSSTQLSVVTRPLNNNFDFGLDTDAWQSVAGGVVGISPCTSVNLDALNFNGAVAERSATTIPLDVSNGGSLTFNIRIGDGIGGCDRPEAGEEVVLEYSIDNGATWHTISATGFNTNLTGWRSQSFALPAGAWTNATRLRWRQTRGAAGTDDNWALDNVVLTPAPVPYTYSWTPAVTLDNTTIYNPVATPSSPTTYTVAVTNPVTGCVSTGAVNIQVNPVLDPGVIEVPQTICWNTAPALLTSTAPATGGSGNYIYRWEQSASPTGPWMSVPGGLMEDDFDADIDPVQWGSIVGGSIATDCGSLSGNALKFTGTAVGNAARYARTNSLDLTHGGSIHFALAMGGTGSANPCNGPDGPSGELVYLEYSTDGGANWYTLATYGDPLTNDMNIPWTSYSVPIPPVARTATTQIRWQQFKQNSNTADVFMLDNVYIASGAPTVTNGYGPEYQPPVLTDTTYYRRVVMDADVTQCDRISNTLMVAVPRLDPGTLVAANQVICAGTVPVIILGDRAAGIHWGPIEYTWQWAHDPSGPWTDFAASDTPDLSPPAITQTTYYRRQAADLTCTEVQHTNVITVTTTQLVLDLTNVFSNVCPASFSQLNVTPRVVSDDFDPAVDASVWHTIVGGAVATNCGAMSGNALKFTGPGTGNAARYAATIPVDVSAGGFVNFAMQIGGTGGSEPCNGPDGLDGELVFLEYSVDGGNTWVNIATYGDPLTQNMNFPWANYSVPIPVAAQTGSTRFRWQQFKQNSNAADVFMLDNVAIVPASITYTYSWSPADGLSDPAIPNPVASPGTETTYTVTVTNPITGCQGTASTIVIPSGFDVNVRRSLSKICAGGSFQMTATAGAFAFSDDFDPDIDSALWVIDGGRITHATQVYEGCGAVAWYGLYFDGYPAPRYARTYPLDVSAGGTVSYSLRVGGGGTCDNIEAGESVLFQYSTDGGSVWTTLTTHATNIGWTTFNPAIPAGAQTPNTLFRWWQTAQDAANDANWALDNVSIIPAAIPYTYSWSPATYLDDPAIANPTATNVTADITYTVTVTNTNTGCTGTATVPVTLGPCDMEVEALSQPAYVCLDGETQLQARTVAQVFSDDFDPTYDPRLWGTINGGRVTLERCGSVSGFAMMFDGLLSLRSIQTRPLDVSTGGTITYRMRVGGDGGSATGCNDVEADHNDEVYFGYSIDGGATWIEIRDRVGTNSTAWGSYTVAIPDAAKTSCTIFRWWQHDSSSPAQRRPPDNMPIHQVDNWAIDNVSITVNPLSYTWLWTPATGLDDPTLPNPRLSPVTGPQMYTVTMTNTLTGCSGTDSIDPYNPDPEAFDITTTATPVVLCPGTSATLTTEVAGLDDDFDPGIDAGMWSDITGGFAGTGCGASSGTLALYFNGNPNPVRSATTKALNTATGGNLVFNMRLGNAGLPCEQIDIIPSQEEVYVQYSIDAGATWVDLEVNYVTSSGFLAHSLPIPDEARTNATMFRFYQYNNDNNNAGNWAIDDIRFIPNADPYLYSWRNLTEGGTAGIVSPTQATTVVNPVRTTYYEVTITDSISNCPSYDTVQVIVGFSPVVVSAATTQLCPGSSTQLQALVVPFVDDFDPDTVGMLWSSIVGGAPAVTCGSAAGNALFFNGTGGYREAVTVPVDVASGGTLDFSLKAGSGGGCDNLDAGEFVRLDYSTDLGTTWTNIASYGNMNWTVHQVAIPAGALTSFTQFRWSLTHNTGTGDNWAIDNVGFTLNPVTYTYSWTPVTGLDDPSSPTPVATITAPVTYTVTITNAATGCLAIDSIHLDMPDGLHWDGSESTDWFDPNNWTPPCVPTCYLNAIITDITAPHQPVIAGATAHADTLTIGPGMTLTIAATDSLLICGDFLNSGTFEPHNGVLGFVGNVNQNYRNAGPEELHDVVVDNASTVTLMDNMTLEAGGSLKWGTLAGRILTGTADTVIVKNISGGSVSGHSVSGYVQGILRRHVDQAAAQSYDFPVGIDPALLGYQNANITFTAAPTFTYLDAFFTSYASSAIPVFAPFTECDETKDCILDNHGKWTIEPDHAAGTSTYNITLYPLNGTSTQCPGSIPWTVMKRTIVPATGSWVLEGQPCSQGLNPYRAALTTFSEFAPVTGTMPLAIDDLYLSAAPRYSQIDLNWVSDHTTESSALRYVLQRAAPGEPFVPIASRTTAEHSQVAGRYYHMDEEVLPNTQYHYRVIREDLDGAAYHSNIAAAQIRMDDGIYVSSPYPNPTRGGVSLDFNFAEDQWVQVECYNNLGQLVLPAVHKRYTAGVYTLEIPADGLAKGVYSLRVGLKGRQYYFRLSIL